MPANGELTWTTDTVDSAGVVGVGCSITLDNLGNPWISYSDKTPFPAQLKLAHFTGSKWEISTVDTSGDGVTAIAIDTSGNRHILYQESGLTPCLKYAKLFGTSCETQTVDADCIESCGLSIVIDTAGNPHVSYIDLSDLINMVIKYASFTGTGWTKEVVSDGCTSTESGPLQINSAGDPCVSFYHYASNTLMYAQKVGSTWLNQTVDSSGCNPSLKLDSAGNPCISYFKEDGLYYAYFNGGMWIKELVDFTIGKGVFCSLALDSADYPHISYYDAVNGDLKYAYYDGTGWNPQTVDSTGKVGEFTCLALDNYGNPHISYYDEANKDLKYASSAFVLPSVTPESSGVGAVLFSSIAAVACYFGIKKRRK